MAQNKNDNDILQSNAEYLLNAFGVFVTMQHRGSKTMSIPSPQKIKHGTVDCDNATRGDYDTTSVLRSWRKTRKNKDDDNNNERIFPSL